MTKGLTHELGFSRIMIRSSLPTVGKALLRPRIQIERTRACHVTGIVIKELNTRSIIAMTASGRLENYAS